MLTVLKGSSNRGTGGDTIVKAPIATSGNNIYIIWWDNNTGNNDNVMFRASTDGGKTFGDKINLSNSTDAQSQNAQIDTFGDNDSNVIVTWWERNATSNEPVARISTDSGKTFGQIMKLSTNGTMVVVADRTTCLLFFTNNTNYMKLTPLKR
jgi:hypothetical protein